MRVTFNKVAYTILVSYLVVSLYTGYILVRNKVWNMKLQEEKFRQMSELAEDDTDWNPWGEEFENEQLVISHHEPPKILWNLEHTETKHVSSKGNNSNRIYNVEVWGKAAIGHYLWEHIIEGPLEERMGGVWSYGAKTINNIKFIFRTGPGVVPDQVPKNTENLLLILNGREPDTVSFAQTWLKSLQNLSQLQHVGLVLLGNEQCNNSWLQPYMHYNGGLVKFVFLVYDSTEIDNVNFFQWPLGVATYRGFPRVDSSKLPVHIRRPYACNFLGTVYKNSSRENLLKILEGDYFREKCLIKPRIDYRGFPRVDSSKLPVHIRRPYACNFLGTVYKNSSRENLLKILEGDYFREKCLIKPRIDYRGFPRVDSSKLPVHIRRPYACNFLGTVYKNSSRENLLKILEGDYFREKCLIKPRIDWLPLETVNSREEFIQALCQSDLTLNPVGQNTECYRIYEAIAYGSIPIVEDIMTPGNCGKAKISDTFPLRLLKEHNAPIIYIKDWKELTKILENEKSLRHSDKVKRRRDILLWYESFKSKMRQKLIEVISKQFFGVKR